VSRADDVHHEPTTGVDRERSDTMASRVQPVTQQQTTDTALKELLKAGMDSW
jgi:hypothetical protein